MDMGVAKGIATTQKKAISRWFPAIAGVADSLVKDSRTAARLETVEILTDVEQVSSLFASMEDWRLGQIVGLDSAFGDL